MIHVKDHKIRVRSRYVNIFRIPYVSPFTLWTMREIDRITGITHLRVRGMRQVNLAAPLKAAGLNIHRATTFRSRKNNR
jgi:hypothetical protein